MLSMRRIMPIFDLSPQGRKTRPDMAEKKTFSSFGALGSLVFSTDRTRELTPETPPQDPTPAPQQQRLRVRRDTSGRRGKAVTLVEGFCGAAQDLEQLAVRLKRHCGAGGSVKDGQILIQGDVRDKVTALLSADGYRVRQL